MKGKYLPLSLILFLHIIAWFDLKPIWPNSDDFNYTLEALKLMNGHFHLSPSEFQIRMGVYVPVTILSWLMGLSPYTISLWPLLVSLLGISGTYLIVRKYAGDSIATISSALIAINILQITFSAALYPDIMIACYGNLLVLIVFHGRTKERYIYPILSCVLVILAFLTKEAIVFVYPFLAFISISDLIHNRNRWFWKKIFLCGICSSIMVFTFYYLLTGDVLYRLKTSYGFAKEGIIFGDVEQKIKSLYSSNLFIWLLKQPGFIFIILFSLPALFTIKNKPNDFKQYLTIYSLFLLVQFGVLFFLPKYGVIFMQERNWLLIIIPLSILTAYFINEPEKKWIYIIAALLLILIPINYLIVDTKRALLYALFLIPLLLILLKPELKKALLLPFFILAIYFLWTNTNYKAINANTTPTLIIKGDTLVEKR
ncbi:MAG TPA: glycosyltransferase family 39 protein [Bacteroidia bacterium]|jgi:hypothetical protein|nr:glycosyltransferase family 39 protein [Bacteroidia bacterium]